MLDPIPSKLLKEVLQTDLKSPFSVKDTRKGSILTRDRPIWVFSIADADV